MTGIGADWLVVDGVATAWFDAPSMVEGASLVGHVVELSPGIVVDLRATGVRVRLGSDEHGRAVSAAARDLGLAANPAVLQHLSVVVDTAHPAAMTRFWQRVLAYAPAEDGGLTDPWQRDPAMRIRTSTDPRPLRNRIHLDVVRPAAAVEQASPGEATGPFGVRHADPDGNEVDLVPGSALGESSGTADWQAVFSAIACYRTSSPAQQRDLAVAAAALADAADVAAVRAFWVTALGYSPDRRAGASDIYDPRRLNPALVFQELDASETERRRQRNRIHVELAVPSDLAPTRLATTLAAGGRLLDESEDRWLVADPEGNELAIVSGT